MKDPTTGIWTAGGASPSRIPNPLGSGPTGPHSMEERDVRGVYSQPPATGGIRLGGVVAADVGDAIRIDDLRGIKIPYYDGNPFNLDDFILDWEDFAEEVVGEMKGAPRDKWVCRTFPHRLAQDLKEELRDQIREGLIQTEQACFQWLEDEERVGMQVRIRTNSLEFEFAPNSHEFVDPSEFEFATSNSNSPLIRLNSPEA